jgi:hypothetical protein
MFGKGKFDGQFWTTPNVSSEEQRKQRAASQESS